MIQSVTYFQNLLFTFQGGKCQNSFTKYRLIGPSFFYLLSLKKVHLTGGEGRSEETQKGLLKLSNI